MNENQKYVYDALKASGIEVGDEKTFLSGIQSGEGAKWAYDTLKEQGIEVGDYSTYLSAVVPTPITAAFKPEVAGPAELGVLPKVTTQELPNIGITTESMFGTKAPNYFSGEPKGDENYLNISQGKGKKSTFETLKTESGQNKTGIGDFLKATYHKINAGGANVGASLAAFGEDFYRQVGDKIPMFGYYDWTADQLAKVKDFFKSDEQVSKIKSNIYKGKDFTQLAKEGNYLDAAGEVFLTASESIPVSLTAMLGIVSGNPALSFNVMAVHGYQNKKEELSQEDMPQVMKDANAILTGFSAAATEYLGSIPFGKWAKNILLKQGEEVLEKTVKSTMLKSLGDLFKRHGYLFEPITEGVEEFADAVSTNVIDWATGRTDKLEPLKDAGKSFVYGSAGGAQFTAAALPVQTAQRLKAKTAFEKAEQSLSETLVSEGYDTAEMGNLTKGLLEVPVDMATQQITAIAATAGNPEAVAQALTGFYTAGKNYEAVSTSLQKSLAQFREQIKVKQDETESMLRDNANKDTGQIQVVKLSTGEEVQLTGGVLVINPETGKIDFQNSPDTFFYRAPDGSVQPVHKDMIEELVSAAPVEEVVAAERDRIARTEVGKANYTPGDGVVLLNADGSPQLGESGQPIKTTIQAVEDDGVHLVTSEGREVLLSFDEADAKLAAIEDIMPDLTGQTFQYEGMTVEVIGTNPDGTYQVEAYQGENFVGETKLTPEQLQAGRDPLQEDPAQVPEETIQAPQEQVTDLPTTKTGEIDYQSINDPATYMEGLKQEFPEDADAVLNELIEEANQELKKAESKPNAIERRRAVKAARERLDFLNTVKGQQVTPAIEPTNEQPAEQVSDKATQVAQRIQQIKESLPGTGDFLVVNDAAGLVEAIEAAGLSGENLESFRTRVMQPGVRTTGCHYKGVVYVNAAEMRTDEDIILNFVHEAAHVATSRVVTPLEAETIGSDEAFKRLLPNPALYRNEPPKVLGEEIISFSIEYLIHLYGIEALASGEISLVDGEFALIHPLTRVLNILTDGKYNDQIQLIRSNNLPGSEQTDGGSLQPGAGETAEQQPDTGTTVGSADTNRAEPIYTNGQQVNYRGNRYVVNGVSRDLDSGAISYDLEDANGNPAFEDVPEADIITFLDEAIAQQEPNTQPTEAQKEAGNYKKAHITVQGFDITIENPKGSTRSGVDENGKTWSNTMQSHYGYFKRTEGKDGDQIDVFVGDNPESEYVFVVDQNNPATGKFDESKAMLGFNTPEEAKAAYMSNYEADWEGFGAITPVSVEDFKKWLYDGARQRKPFADYADIKKEELKKKDSGVIDPVPVDLSTTEIERVKDEYYTIGNHLHEGTSYFGFLKKEGAKPVKLSVPGDFFYYKEGKEFTISEARTGVYISKGYSLDTAKYVAEDKIARHGGAEGLETIVRTQIAKDGLSPRYAVKVYASEQKVDTSEQKVDTSEQKVGLSKRAQTIKDFTFLSEAPMNRARALTALEKPIRIEDNEVVPYHVYIERMPSGLETGKTKIHSSKAVNGETEVLVVGDNIVSTKAAVHYYEYLQEGGMSYSEYLEAKKKEDAEAQAKADQESLERRKLQEAKDKELKAEQKKRDGAIKLEVLRGEISREGFIHKYTRGEREYLEEVERRRKDSTSKQRDLAIAQNNLSSRQNSIGKYYDTLKDLYVIDPRGEIARKYEYQEGDPVIVTAWGTNIPTTIAEVKKNDPDGEPGYKVNPAEGIFNVHISYEGLKPAKQIDRTTDKLAEYKDGRTPEEKAKLIAAMKAKLAGDSAPQMRQLPETIKVNGVNRPTTNSKGKHIHSTEEGIRNFWEWFNESKVVDEQGRPLVVYHGTPEENAGFNVFTNLNGMHFFTSNKDVADSYTENPEVGIYAVYLKVDNPKELDYNFHNWDYGKVKGYSGKDIVDIADSVKTENKNDGIIAKNIKDPGLYTEDESFGDNYIVFSPNQIKSATGNTGDFNPDNADIRFRQLSKTEENELLGMGMQLAPYLFDEGSVAYPDFRNALTEVFGEDISALAQAMYLGVKYLPTNADYRDRMWGVKEIEQFEKDLTLKSVDNQNKEVTLQSDKQRFISQVKEKLGDEKLNIVALRKLAEQAGLKDAKDTVLQEYAEMAIIAKAREIASQDISPEDKFNQIVELYQTQPTISMRSSERIEKGQFSTPIPMSFLAGEYINAGNPVTVLEPSAGNGMMVFNVSPTKVIANEIDPVRLENLSEQGFNLVTKQDGTQEFNIGKVDAIITNPPFGSSPARDYNGYKISGLDEQMVVNALLNLKDDGRAAIVIGGHTKYNPNGTLAGEKAFLNYLYNFYNVVDVINMDGSFFQKQGTTFPTRMILINGRRLDQTRRYAPLEKDARAEIVTDFNELYNRVSNETNSILQPGISDSNSDTVGLPAPENVGGNTPQGGTETNTTVSGGRGKSVSSGGRSSGSTGRTGKSGGTTRTNNDVRRNGGTSTRSEQLPDVRSRQGASERVLGQDPLQFLNRGDELAGKPLEVDISKEKTPYPAKSKSEEIGSVVPTNTAQPIHDSLSVFKDVDAYVQTKLGYATKEELFEALAAEQIDSVALAIYQIERGKALIIGDMTGVGKGRQAAAIIRYATLQGLKPVFLTEKAHLFSDIYRDLRDIGSGGLVPFIFNAKGDKSDPTITDEDGRVIYKPLSDRERGEAFKIGGIPQGYDYAILTYSQLNAGTGKVSPKKDLFLNIIQDNILVMDESHNAGGEGNTGKFLTEAIPATRGVVYLSGTFAKRADNMPVYAVKTDMSEANMSNQELIEAIKKGGVPLQEIMSKNLVSAGQMLRRERDFTGVKIDWVNLVSDKEKEYRVFDDVISVFNDLIAFQRDYVNPIIEEMNESMVDVQGSAESRKGTKDLGVSNVPFASKTFNVVRQLLFSLKAEQVAQEAIAEIENGRKPVIAVSNTMEAFLNELGVAGDKIANYDFGVTLRRGLEGLLRFTTRDGMGEAKPGTINLTELNPEAAEVYNRISETIDRLSSGITISPIDVIKDRIRKAGYTVGELTGRTNELIFNQDGTATITKRVHTDKKKLARDFNSGDLDALILNQSASTGISLHASERFADQRQRVMLVAQAQLDVNTEIQVRGRIDRTGQVYRGDYKYLISAVPAEQRLIMMLKAKLKSLDANTTSSQKSSANEIEVVDFLNKYGDELCVEYLKENPDINEKLLDPFGFEGKSEEELSRITNIEDAATRVAGRVALLSVKEQEEFYRDISEKYTTLINYLNDSGANDLEITTLPLRAETKEAIVVVKGKGGDNPFAQDSVRETVEIDVLKKPMSAKEISEESTRLLEGMSDTEYKDNLLKRLDDFMVNQTSAEIDRVTAGFDRKKPVYLEKIRKEALKGNAGNDVEVTVDEAAQAWENQKEVKIQQHALKVRNKFENIKRVIRSMPVGKPVMIPTTIDIGPATAYVEGFFLGYRVKGKMNPSTITAVFAPLDSRRRIEVPLSKMGFINAVYAETMASRWRMKADLDNWDSLVPTRTRRTGYIVTGNVLQAYGTVDNGQLITYTTVDGNVRQGILLPENYKADYQRMRVQINQLAGDIREGKMVTDTTKEVTIRKERSGGYGIFVPVSKARGGKYFLDRGLRDLIVGGDFRQMGQSMAGAITESNLENTLNYLSEKFNTSVEIAAEKTEVPRFRQIPDMGYYSPTEKALESISQEKGTRDQFKAMLLKNGAKQAELDWMGFDELPEKLTKTDIQNWIDENRIEVQEVEKGIKNLEFKTRDVRSVEKDTRPEFTDNWFVNIGGNDIQVRADNDVSAVQLALQKANNFKEISTKFSQYVLPGGKNYKELLLTMPAKKNIFDPKKVEINRRYQSATQGNVDLIYDGKMIYKGLDLFKNYKERTDEELITIVQNAFIVGDKFNKIENEQGNFISSHFDEPNILAHVRFNEREVNGERVLFIEEVQSDWAQKGKKEGFKGTIKELPYNYEVGTMGNNFYIVDPNRPGGYVSSGRTYEEAKENALKLLNGKGIPDMPFKKTDQWVNLALRRMMRYAAENGFDRIAWTTGEQQAERYDLSKSIEKVEYWKVEREDLKEPKYGIYVYGKQGNRVYSTNKSLASTSELEDIIGKELTGKIVENATNDVKEFSGLDLKVGGEGMKAFYDNIIPSAASKLGKPFGARVELISFNTLNTSNTNVETNNKGGYILVDKKGNILSSMSKETGDGFSKQDLHSELIYLAKRYPTMNDKAMVQSLPITESMQKTFIEDGFPLFRQTLPEKPNAKDYQDDIAGYANALREYHKETSKLIPELAQEAHKALSGDIDEMLRKRQDADRPLKLMQRFIADKGGVVEDKHDVYNDKNRSAGRSTYRAQQFEKNEMKAITDIYRDIIHSKTLDGLPAVPFDPKQTTEGMRKIGAYLQAKDIQEAIELGLVDRGEVGFFEAAGVTHTEYIDQFEESVSAEKVTDLWKAVKAATQFALDAEHEAGIISAADYAVFSAREFYVPQRGWDERDTKDGETFYVRQGRVYSDAYNPVVIRAKGRESLASDPLKYIQSTAHSAVLTSEKNLYKRRALALVKDNITIGRQSGMFDFKRTWFVNTKEKDEAGNLLYDEVFERPAQELFDQDAETYQKIKELRKEAAQVKRDVNSEIKKALGQGDLSHVAELEEYKGAKLDELSEQIREAIESINIKTKVNDQFARRRTSDEAKQHEVVVYDRGQRYVITFGDERVANALNNRQENFVLPRFLQTWGKATRWYSSIMTQYNPAFALWNFARDIQLANYVLANEQGPKFWAAFNKNLFEEAVVKGALLRHMAGKEDMRYNSDKLLRQFFEDGAATGYTYLKDLDQLQANLRKAIEPTLLQSTLSSQINILNGKAIGKVFSALTEFSEILTRFAAYKTAVDTGLSREQAATIAKDVTVNFNRKGSDTRIVSSLFFFFNASIQGAYRGVSLRKYGARFAGAVAALVALGFMNTLFNPDDPEKERNWSEYDYMQNVMLFGVKLPVAHFFRGFWGFGAQMALAYQGKKSIANAMFDAGKHFANEIVPQQMNPLNLWKWDKESNSLAYDGVRDFVPSIITPVFDIAENKTFTGATVYREPFPGQDNVPQAFLGKRGVSKAAQGVSNALLEAGGGDKNIKDIYKADGSKIAPVFDVNPSILEYLATSYTGGVGKFFLDTYKTVEDIMLTGEVDLTKAPVINRMVKPYNEEKIFYGKYYELLRRIKTYDDSVRERRKAFVVDGGSYDPAINSYIELMTSPRGRIVYRAKALQDQVEGLMDTVDKLRMAGKEKQADDFSKKLTGKIKEINDLLTEWNNIKE